MPSMTHKHLLAQLFNAVGFWSSKTVSKYHSLLLQFKIQKFGQWRLACNITIYIHIQELTIPKLTGGTTVKPTY